MLEAFIVLMMVLFLASCLAAIAPIANLEMKAYRTLEIDADLKRDALHRVLVWAIRSGIFFALAAFLLPWTMPETPSPTVGAVLASAFISLVIAALGVLLLWGGAHLVVWKLEQGWIPLWRKREARKTPLPEEKTRADVRDPTDWT